MSEPRRYVKPGAFTSRVFNPVVGWLTRRGIRLAGSAVLEVRGRKSGEPRTTPVNPLSLDGERYLLAPRGETEWVRNIRVAGRAALVYGRRREEFTIVEVPDAEKLPIIRAYLKAWAWEVGSFFEGISVKSSDQEVAAVASGFPIFRIVAA
ncbi:nitroreductase family deazaflavin-dependent oxidoreductase [Gryllotalpicola koreensis]|uniref:Nitroreductase family deazaflavin-dependent oxidoreductase n=1 Tax=Gryllotalpicola koreensis TaxID=993086 RepID=A0ABP7ZW70_9MICO